MRSLVWPALLALAACASEDDRPRDAQYITATILGPTCGRAECHSQFVQAGPDGTPIVLDTYDHARQTLLGDTDAEGKAPLIGLSSGAYDPIDIDDSPLIQWVTQIDPFGQGIGRMPLDAPLPNADVELLKAWIIGPVVQTDEGVACATGSATATCPDLDDQCIDNECVRVTYPDPAHGAACDPSRHSGVVCNGTSMVECKPDWSFGDVIQSCPVGCVDFPLDAPVSCLQ